MLGNAIREGLVALARDELSRPGGRERMSEALRAALSVVDGPGSIYIRLPATGVGVALDELVEHLISARDHAEFLHDAVIIVRQPPLS